MLPNETDNKNIESSNVTDIDVSSLNQNTEGSKWQDKLKFNNKKVKEKIRDIRIKPEFIEAGKKAAGTVKEKIINVKETINQSLIDEKNERTYSVFAYVPIVGIIVVFLFKRNQKLSKIHAINAAYLQIGFVAIWIAIWLLENIPVLSDILKFIMAIPYITNALIYLNILMLIVFSIYGIFKANKGIKWKVPYVVDFINNKKILKKNLVNIK